MYYHVYKTCIFCFLLNAQQVFAQQHPSFRGARASGMAVQGINLPSPYSALTNPATLAETSVISIFSGVEERMNLAAFRTVAAGVVLPIQEHFGGSIAFARMGNAVYNEQVFSVGIAHSLEGVQLGVRTELLQYLAQDVDSRAVPLIHFGVTTQLTEELNLGALVTNVFQAGFDGDFFRQVPSAVAIALKYNILSSLKILVEVEKESIQATAFGLGLEYFPTEHLALRTGFQNNPRLIAFGMGYRMENIWFDYAFQLNGLPGNVHQVSGVFTIPRKSNDKK